MAGNHVPKPCDDRCLGPKKHSWNPDDPGTVSPVTATPTAPTGASPTSQVSTHALTRWLPGMLVLSAIWGSSFLFIKVGVSELHPLYVALGRVGSGAIALLLILLLTQSPLPRDLRVWGHNAVVAIVGVAVPFTLFGYGEQHVSSILAGIWNSITPLVVLPLAVIAFRTERMSVRRLVGLLLGLLGALMILGIWQG